LFRGIWFAESYPKGRSPSTPLKYASLRMTEYLFDMKIEDRALNERLQAFGVVNGDDRILD
jgi:hypothetical protein